jgi:Xaa-Pro aminopeptidase
LASRPRHERAREIAGECPLLTADLATVTWLTGLVADIEWGPSPFTAPPVALIHPDGSLLVVASEDEALSVAAGVDVLAFPGFAVEDVDREREALSRALAALEGADAVSADVASLPGALAWELARSGVEVVDVGAELRRARAVKDPDELEAIRAAIAVADAGQKAARAGLSAGRSELELWAETRFALEHAAGGRIPVLADFVTGERTGEVGGLPGERAVLEGDLLLVDLVPRVGGYWADSCATVACGEATATARRAYERSRAALERALELVRPHASAAEIDEAARSEVGGEGYPHHTGHGIGTSFHEEPRIVPGTDRMLEPGMVVALEPGAYEDGVGVRLELVVVVTADGYEVLSGHDLSL